MKHAGMSGKTLYLKRLALNAKADRKLVERLDAAARIEEDILEIHKVS